jgi:hypothetical protein
LNDHITTNTITSENPLIKQTYSHSTSYETKTIHRDRNHSRDSSPSANTNSNRSPSPTSGYASSSVQGERILRDSTSPPPAHVPQHEYLNVNHLFLQKKINTIFLILFRHDHHQIAMESIDNHHQL